MPAAAGASATDDGSALNDLMALADGEEIDSLDPRPIGDEDLYKFSEQPFLKPEEPIEPRTSVLVSKKDTGPPLTCPSCQTQLAPGVQICMACGIDAKTGRAPLMVEDDNLDDAYTVGENVVWCFSWIIPLGFYPVASEAFGTRVPWTVRGIGLACVLFSLWGFFALMYATDPTPAARNMMLWPNDLTPPAVEATEGFENAWDPNAIVGDHNGASGRDPNQLSWSVSDPNSFYVQYDEDELRSLGIGYHNYQLLTSQFLHGGPIHLLGNILFLFIFGSRVNALIGNYLTLILYPLLGMLAGLIHLSMTDDLVPYVGASGAIMGMAGMYLVFFPAHKIHTALWFRGGLSGLFLLLLFLPCFFVFLMIGIALVFKLFARFIEIRGFWYVLFWIAFDVYFVYFQIEDGTAHWAHLGGFMAGAAIAMLLLVGRMVNARGSDILSIALGKHSWPLIGKPTVRRLSLP